MAPKKQNGHSASLLNKSMKQRKKLAKREARAMLTMEQIKLAVQKAEQKVAKAQKKLEDRQAHLKVFEAQVSAIQEESQQSSESQQ
jgi:hypothetical protein